MYWLATFFRRRHSEGCGPSSLLWSFEKGLAPAVRARNASHSEGSVLRRRTSKSSFEKGLLIRSRSKQGMLRAWIRNPRNPPKDVVLLRRQVRVPKKKTTMHEKNMYTIEGKVAEWFKATDQICWLSSSQVRILPFPNDVHCGRLEGFAFTEEPWRKASLRRCGARMLCARIRNPRNPPKDGSFEEASKSACGDLRRTLCKRLKSIFRRNLR